jgi:hypothetical protein
MAMMAAIHGDSNNQFIKSDRSLHPIAGSCSGKADRISTDHRIRSEIGGFINLSTLVSVKDSGQNPALSP